MCEPGVIDIVNFNKNSIEPYSDLVEHAFLQYVQNESQTETEPCCSDPLNTTETNNDLSDQNIGSNSEEQSSFAFSVNIQTNDQLISNIRTLNFKTEAKFFQYILQWTRKQYYFHSPVRMLKKPDPFFYIFNWWRRLWKSPHVIKNCIQFSYENSS